MITGSTGMLGRLLKSRIALNDVESLTPTREELNLLEYSSLADYIKENRPTHIIHCAAKVGGILDNIKHPSSYIMENVRIDNNILWASKTQSVKNLLYISSSCVYPRLGSQPLKTSSLLSGYLEPTNQSYALAKLTGMESARTISNEFGFNYRSVIASNLYGPGDNFKIENSHLVSAALKKVHEAKTKKKADIEIFGSGTARREFTYVVDLADWISEVALSSVEIPQELNVGSGIDYSIDDYYRIAFEVIGYYPQMVHNLSMPEGMQQKLMDSSEAMEKWGWKPKTGIQEGMMKTYEWWLGQNQ